MKPTTQLMIAMPPQATTLKMAIKQQNIGMKQINDNDVAFNIGPVEASATMEQLEEESKRIHEHVLNAHAM